MKTHKNPSLREGPKPFVKASSGATQSLSKEPSPPTCPPKLALEGKKWFVEYQVDKPNLLISQTRMDQCVYIFRCSNTVVQVKVIAFSFFYVFFQLYSISHLTEKKNCGYLMKGLLPEYHFLFNPFASIGRTSTSKGKVKVKVKDICLNISFLT